jgi:putative hydrolase of the HAD superfamily
MPIETVFLDAGGVLVNPNWVRVADALARHGVDASADALAAAEPGAKRLLDAPEPIQSTNDAARGWLYFDLVLEGAGIARSDRTDAALRELQRYHAEWNLWESVPEDVPGSLDRLKEAGLRLVVVSNANGTVEATFTRLGLRERFDVVIDSFHEGVEKPDPAIFERALTRAGATRETTVHAGDFYHVDVVGARAAGLRAWLVDVAGVNADRDCPRVGSMSELARRVLSGAE